MVSSRLPEFWLISLRSFLLGFRDAYILSWDICDWMGVCCTSTLLNVSAEEPIHTLVENLVIDLQRIHVRCVISYTVTTLNFKSTATEICLSLKCKQGCQLAWRVFHHGSFSFTWTTTQWRNAIFFFLHEILCIHPEL